jgi:hypothetical protein
MKYLVLELSLIQKYLQSLAVQYNINYLNMPAVMGNKLKKVSVFINKYGQVQEGTIYQENNRNVTTGLPATNRVPTENGTNEEEKNK